MKLSIIISAYNELNMILEIIKRVQNERLEKEIIIVEP
jgi:glycosyltransferase involved in cell wall biosynthesis